MTKGTRRTGVECLRLSSAQPCARLASSKGVPRALCVPRVLLRRSTQVTDCVILFTILVNVRGSMRTFPQNYHVKLRECANG
jgi:hypothetical protein